MVASGVDAGRAAPDVAPVGRADRVVAPVAPDVAPAGRAAGAALAAGAGQRKAGVVAALAAVGAGVASVLPQLRVAPPSGSALTTVTIILIAGRRPAPMPVMPTCGGAGHSAPPAPSVARLCWSDLVLSSNYPRC